MSQTEALCAAVAGTGYDDIPPHVRDFAKRMLLDTVGVTLVGGDEPAVRIAKDLSIDGSSSGRDATVFGSGETGSPRDVAFVNGIMGHALDFDDVHSTMGGHPSVPVLPAVFAIGERGRATGRDLLEAFVLGTEVELVLADVMNPGHYERGWHPTAVFGHLGATAAAGIMLDLDTDGLRQAMGIAASHASGMKANFGTMTKPYHVGNSARAGVEAASLAASGFTANPSILEAEFGGYCELFQGNPTYDFDEHIDRFGDPWRILDPPVVFKPYPCCGSVHSAIDAALALRETEDLAAGDIARVEVTEHPRRLPHTDRPNPTNGLEGKFSVQYCVAVALRTGEVWLDAFADDAVSDPVNRTLLERVTARADSSLSDREQWRATVEVELEDGTTVGHTVPAPKGSADNPMTEDELREKYMRCATSVLSENDSAWLLERIEDIESVEDISELGSVFRPDR